MLFNHFILENKKVSAPLPLIMLGKGTDTSVLPPLFISFVQKIPQRYKNYTRQSIGCNPFKSLNF